MNPRPIIFGHRGASADAPENTLRAFQLALDQGADGIETDLRLTADGVMVCFHDADGQRLMGRPEPISELTYAVLGEMAADSPFFDGEQVPTLADVLDWRPASCALMLELKDARFHTPGVTRQFKSQLDAAAIRAPYWVSSFDEVSLRMAREVMPGVPLVYISRGEVPLADLWMEAYSPHYTVLEETPALCRAIQQAGKLISVWDPHPEERVDFYRAHPVDTVTANAPGLFLSRWEAMERDFLLKPAQ